MAPVSDTQKPLPLEASAAEWERGWRVRLAVRAEHVELAKQAVIYERVVLRRHEMDRFDHVAEVVRREELSVEVEGDAAAFVSSNRPATGAERYLNVPAPPGQAIPSSLPSDDRNREE